jgi:anti-sigma factor RsiW
MSEHAHGKDPQCLEVFARLSEYLDGDLPAAGCKEIEAHMADCPPCIAFLRSLRGCVEASHTFHSHEKPAPLSAEEVKRLKEAWQAALHRRH